jgi:hypothetical protein
MRPATRGSLARAGSYALAYPLAVDPGACEIGTPPFLPRAGRATTIVSDGQSRVKQSPLVDQLVAMSSGRGDNQFEYGIRQPTWQPVRTRSRRTRHPLGNSLLPAVPPMPHTMPPSPVADTKCASSSLPSSAVTAHHQHVHGRHSLPLMPPSSSCPNQSRL